VSQTTKNPADAQQRAGRRSVDELAQRRSDRRVRWTVLAVVAALLAALAAVALLSRGADPAGTTEGTVGDFTAVPAGVDDVTGAVPVAPDVTPKSGAPQLDIWEDFQCPACAKTEQLAGAGIVALARSGNATVNWRVTTFLDDRLPGESSQRAAEAWGCAIDAGRAVEFHSELFAAQPTVEGAGFSTAQLLRVGMQSGIGGADYRTFQGCVADRRYAQWVVSSTAEFNRTQVPGTPTGYLNGHPLPSGTLADLPALTAAIRNPR